MKLSWIKKLARKRQLKIASNALVRYVEQFGHPTNKVANMVHDMVDDLVVEDEDQVLSAMVFADEIDKSGINDTGVTWDLNGEKRTGDGRLIKEEEK